jgi:TonB family protein
MKTQNQILSRGSRSHLIILSVTLVLILAIFSCGKNKRAGADEKMVYTEVDSMPVFAGGDQGIINYIAQNTTYPEKAKENKITGKVIVRFVVEKDGKVAGAEVLKSVDPLLDAEALRVVSSLPKFEKPGIKDGKAVSVFYMIPITFALQ